MVKKVEHRRVDTGTLLEWYRSMVFVRRFEEQSEARKRPPMILSIPTA
jgi:TPP-dependent pyruvate/acetoin dehydrogenase alpha subunit